MMEMYECSYYGGIDDWFQPLAAIPPPCSSSWPASSPPLLLSHHEDILHTAGDHGAALPDGIGGCSTADIVIKEEDIAPGYRLPFPALAATVDVDSYIYQQPFHPDQSVSSTLPAAAGAAGGGNDDDLLMLPFSDIDLDAFADMRGVVHDIKASPPHSTLDAANAAAPAVGTHRSGTQNDDAFRDMAEFDDLVQQHDAGDDSLSMVVAAGYEMGVRHATELQKPQVLPAAATETTTSPLLLPPARRVMRSRRVGSSSAASATRLDHIGFEDLRRYFYMPITRAAREMNVGLTVLKKRCRELGVARWPHRKMKSLRSLILNVQEMGRKGMPAEAMRRELEALEKCCALMEQDPAVELTERTKKLRQACFKENYKRRRAATVDMVLDHCFNFATGDVDVHGYHNQHQQQLALPPPAAAPAAGHRRIEFFGY